MNTVKPPPPWLARELAIAQQADKLFISIGEVRYIEKSRKKPLEEDRIPRRLKRIYRKSRMRACVEALRKVQRESR